MILPLLFLKHLFSLKELHKSFFVILQRILYFLLDVWLFSCVFSTLYSALHIFNLELVTLDVLLIICLRQYVLQCLQVSWVILYGFQQFVKILLVILRLLQFTTIVLPY